MTRLETMLTAGPYQGYTYAYPHKTAYRPFTPQIPLSDVWRPEPRDALFLYLHIPFCEMRCGFCNLFTQVGAGDNVHKNYLDVLARQADRVRDAIAPASFARLAIGGGTPTILEPPDLERVMRIAETVMGASTNSVPFSIETSPGTCAPARLAVLKAAGVTRISIGVESFHQEETAAVYRPQTKPQVLQALDNIRAADIPSLNIDLIYGLPNQTVTSWIDSLEAALNFAPEELYLYPLYVRPLTGLDRSHRSWDDLRRDCYRAARAHLLTAGYEQVSMRMFRRPTTLPEPGPVYCCQDDGMVGLGCGARSYTRHLHYSSEYAVGARGVREIIGNYLQKADSDFGGIDYGCSLDHSEQRRRYVLQSLLQAEGLSCSTYLARFHTNLWEDLPELIDLVELQLATRNDDSLRLTPEGLELSDVIGPWLYSAQVQELMEAYELR